MQKRGQCLLLLGVAVGVVLLSLSVPAFFGTKSGQLIQPAEAASADRIPAPLLTGYDPDTAEHQKTIVPFLRQHCLKCHGPDAQKADFRVDQELPNDFLTRSVAEKWSEVLNKLNAAEMPPKKEPQPSAADVAKVADWIARERLRGEKARQGTSIVLRRLNRNEYNNTIRELTGIDMQPAESFPADPAAGGFDNNGSALSLSPLQLELYVKAAQQVLDRAIVTEKERPPSIKWRFQIEEGFPEPISYGEVPQEHPVNIDGQRMSVNPGCNLKRGDMTVLRRPLWDTCGDARFGQFKVPHAGYYIVRMRAAGVVPPQADVVRVATEMHERAQEKNESKIADPAQRRLARESFETHTRSRLTEHFSSRHYRYGPPRIKITYHLGGTPGILGEFDVPAPANDPAIYEVRAWFEPIGGTGVTFNNVYQIPRNNWNFWLQGNKDFARPELLVDWMELEGPMYDSWPPSSHQRILIGSPNKGKSEDAYARDVLANFMRRAYRRPLRDDEVDSKLALFKKVRPNFPSFEEAIKAPLVAVLSSPHFLYLVEDGGTTGDNARPLNDFELAARLSYFLWSGMPDDELARLAEQRKLGNAQTLAAQTKRMLADPRCEQFVKNFAGQWLKLRELGANPPARNLFPEYDDHLEVSMRGEAEAFFAHILRNDLSVLNFIRSDFVVINERLARFYDIAGVKGDHFREVKVPKGVPRGGLVTQASMLSVTSNGTRTSPVWRGVWILERLLGDPPPPPPPNAGDIPPGVPGIDKATVRDRLRIHREQPQCARCHNKIDPLGFALENFNAAGEWREREGRNGSEYGPNDPLIDARAQLPGGTEFIGVEGLQKELLKREEQFLHCLAEKLYVYALGRELAYADQPTIDGAVQHMKKNGLTLRSLIHHIVSSEAFRSK